MKRSNKFIAYAILAAAALFAGCDDDGGGGGGLDDIPDSEIVTALIVNEGGFNAGTSSISGIMKDKSVKSDIYREYAEKTLGVSPQSITLLGGYLYICVSGPSGGSGTIEVVDALTFAHVKTISFPTGTEPFTPYAICNVHNTRKLAVVSGANSNYMWILDYGGNTILKEMYVGTPTQDMAAISGNLYILASKFESTPPYLNVTKLFRWEIEVMLGLKTDPDGNLIPPPDPNIPDVIIEPDLTTPDPSDMIDVAPMDRSHLVVDYHNHVWTYTANGLKCVDPDINNVIKTLSFQDNLGPAGFGFSGRMVIDGTGKALYFSATDLADMKTYIYSARVDDPDLDDAYENPRMDVSEINFYNLALNLEGSALYVTDAGDWSSAGKVYEYNLASEQTTTYNVGINPFFIHFIRR